MPFVAFVNAADHLTNTDADLIVEALRRQALEDFAPLWPGIEIFAPLFVASEKDLPQNAYPIVFVNDADAPDVEAYHSVDRGGKYFGHVFVNVLLKQGGVFDAVSRGAGHEYFELLGNPTCLQYVPGTPRPEGSWYLRELCDPVQANSYTKTLERGGHKIPVRVPDIAGPGYFGLGGPLSIMGSPRGPFEMANGGYQVISDEHGTDSNVWGIAGARLPSAAVRAANAAHSRPVRRARANITKRAY